jgi:hypothetical protein
VRRKGRIQLVRDDEDGSVNPSPEKSNMSDSSPKPSPARESTKKRRGLRMHDSDSDDGSSKEEQSKVDADESEDEGEKTSVPVEDSKEARKRELAEMAERARKAKEADEEQEKKKKKEKKHKDKESRRDRREENASAKKRRRHGKEGKKSHKKSKKEKSKSSSSSSGSNDAEREQELLSRQLSIIIATAMLENDTSLSKKMCREKLSPIFGEARVEANKAFISDEVGRILSHCSELSESEVPHYLARFEPVTEYDMLPLRVLISKQLEYILLHAVAEGDESLSRRGCREKLAEVFGEDVIEKIRDEVDAEVKKKLTEYASLDKDVIERRAEGVHKVESRHIAGKSLGNKRGKESDGSDGSSSYEDSDSGAESSAAMSSDADYSSDMDSRKTAKKSKKRGGRAGPLGGAVCVLAGKMFTDDKKNAAKITELIESLGGKVQSMVTHKVEYIVVDKAQKSIPGNDSRVKSARKHRLRIVLSSFFDECKSSGRCVCLLTLHTSTRAYVYMSLYVCARARMYVFVCVCLFLCVCINTAYHMQLSGCRYPLMCVLVYKYITHIHTYTDKIHTAPHVAMYVANIRVCVCTHNTFNHIVCTNIHIQHG